MPKQPPPGAPPMPKQPPPGRRRRGDGPPHRRSSNAVRADAPLQPMRVRPHLPRKRLGAPTRSRGPSTRRRIIGKGRPPTLDKVTSQHIRCSGGCQPFWAFQMALMQQSAGMKTHLGILLAMVWKSSTQLSSSPRWRTEVISPRWRTFPKTSTSYSHGRGC